MRHGTGVVGISAATLKIVNKMAARVIGRASGRSNFARLALDGFNPGNLMFLDPLVSWTRALWDGIFELDLLRHAWLNALQIAG